MNSINPLNNAQFPVSSDTWVFIQNMVLLVAKLAAIGGDNYILEGCVETGNNVSSGTLIINGELIPFAGGVKTTYVTVVETNRNVNVGNTVFNNIYTEKIAQFGTGINNIVWTDLVRIVTLSNKANKSYTDIELAKKIDKPTDDWHDAEISQGVVIPTGYFLKYRKTTDNEIELFGAITMPEFFSHIIFQLPEGYRPFKTMIFPIGGDRTDVIENNDIFSLTLYDNGNVTITSFAVIDDNKVFYFNHKIRLGL